MFDGVFGKSNSAPEYDETKEFNNTLGPLIEEVHRAAGSLNVPMITMACLSYNEGHVHGEEAVEAGMLIAAHSRKHNGENWYPDMMETILRLMQDPKRMVVLKSLMPVIEMMADRNVKGGAIHLDSRIVGGDDWDIAHWMNKLLGDDDEDE